MIVTLIHLKFAKMIGCFCFDLNSYWNKTISCTVPFAKTHSTLQERFALFINKVGFFIYLFDVLYKINYNQNSIRSPFFIRRVNHIRNENQGSFNFD